MGTARGLSSGCSKRAWQWVQKEGLTFRFPLLSSLTRNGKICTHLLIILLLSREVFFKCGQARLIIYSFPQPILLH